MPDELELPQVFQHWQLAPTAQAGAELSFEAATAPVEEISRWSLDLPADSAEADAYLAQAEAQLQATQALLEAAPQRLESFISRLESGGEAHFALEASPTASAAEQSAEASLISWVEAFQPGQIAFGGEGLAQSQVGEAVSQFQQVMNNLLGLLLHLAQIETRLQGQLLASSIVSWKGDVNTTWGEGTLVEERKLHQRSLALALTSRLATLNMLTTVAQGAAKIAVLVAAPGGALLALPAAWKYLNILLSQIRNSNL